MTSQVSIEAAPVHAGRRSIAPSLLLPGALVLLPVLISAAFVWTFGVDVPFWDEWNDHPRS